MIPPPIMFNFSGTLSIFRISLLVKPYWLPGMSGMKGRAPVAINRLSQSKDSPFTSI